MADNRQRYLAAPSDEAILMEIRQVCAILRGFGQGSPAERRAHAKAYEFADQTLERALSDAEAVRRHDGDRKALPWFQHSSLFYFELVLKRIQDHRS